MVAVAEEMPGVPDRAVLLRAIEEERAILTFDRDYGALIYRHGLPAPVGVIYLRFAPQSPLETAERVLTLTGTPGLTLEERLTVVEPSQVRQRSLP